VRHWLADLSREIADGLKDGSLPPLHVDHLWIGGDDRARLLDWPPPSPPSPSTVDTASARLRASLPANVTDSASAQQFLYGVAAGALRGVHPDVARASLPSTPLPASARTLLLELRDGKVPTPDLVGARASDTLRTPAAFPRRRRLIQLAACCFIPVILAFAVFAVITLQIRSQTADPDAFKLKSCLQQLVALDKKGAAKLTAKDLAQREAIEIYIAEYLREPAEDTAAYAKAFPAAGSVQKEYQMAQRALSSHQYDRRSRSRTPTPWSRSAADTSRGCSTARPQCEPDGDDGSAGAGFGLPRFDRRARHAQQLHDARHGCGPRHLGRPRRHAPPRVAADDRHVVPAVALVAAFQARSGDQGQHRRMGIPLYDSSGHPRRRRGLGLAASVTRTSGSNRRHMDRPALK
jgi:hypothetical protein